MSIEKDLEQYRGELYNSILVQNHVEKEDLLASQHAKNIETVIQTEEQIQLNKEQLTYQKRKDAAQRKLERERLAQELEIKKVELALKEKELDLKANELKIKERLAELEDKKIDSDLRIAELQQKTSKFNAITNVTGGLVKLGVHTGLALTDMSYSYKHYGISSKLFNKEVDNALK